LAVRRNLDLAALHFLPEVARSITLALSWQFESGD
jgi:hypothetical protein